MRPTSIFRVVLLIALLLATGCASKNKGIIEGTKWSSVAATVKGTTLPAGALQLEFGSDGSLVYKGGTQTIQVPDGTPIVTTVPAALSRTDEKSAALDIKSERETTTMER